MGLFDLFKGAKGDPAESLPQNDAEKWAVAAYALWSKYAAAYIQGAGLESGVADKVSESEENYKRLAAMPDGPYTVAWETPIG